MGKGGQVTLFIILGIVLFALTALILYTRQTAFLSPTPENLRKEFEPITEHVVECIRDGVSDYGADQLIVLAGKQGSYISPVRDTYILFNDSKVSYLCYNIESSPECYNRLRLKDSIEEELAVNIKSILDQCLEVDGFSRFRGYEIATSPYSVDVDIRKDDVLVKLAFPVTIKRGENEASLSEFSTVLNYPLGDLYEVAQDIVNLEAQGTDFPTVEYMLAKNGRFTIHRYLPYPDKVYVLKRYDNGYVLQFAIQGEVS